MDQKYKVEIEITVENEMLELYGHDVIDDVVLEALDEAPFQVNSITVVKI
ncbi:hypothetical protein [Lacrimispora celerecrescens]|nr:hypothetical protein [Lacrimispora celerecrescens]